MLRVVQGKGGIDREVPLSKKLLGALREYYRWMRPETYLFPGTVDHLRADKPITEKIVWQAVHEAAIRAGIKKRVTPHTLLFCHTPSRIRRLPEEHPADARPFGLGGNSSLCADSGYV